MTINCKGQLIDLNTPKVMGILNLTPDSFYDGGKYKNESQILNQVEKMLNEGATFIDLGAYSSRPDAENISLDEEKQRILPIVELVLESFPEALLSIDTFRSEIASFCLEQGAALINDISAGQLDAQMLKVAAEYQVPYIAMHMKGTPQTMKTQTNYDDMLKEIQFYFSDLVSVANEHKLNDLILDPGFGFAKTVEQNFSLLKNLKLLQFHNRPILVGLSRKSMIYKTLHASPEEALNGTTNLQTVALLNGANILRVHDVKEAIETIRLINTMNNADC